MTQKIDTDKLLSVAEVLFEEIQPIIQTDKEPPIFAPIAQAWDNSEFMRNARKNTNMVLMLASLGGEDKFHEILELTLKQLTKMCFVMGVLCGQRYEQSQAMEKSFEHSFGPDLAS